jgi:ABC-type multidrug transport system permease subunit
MLDGDDSNVECRILFISFPFWFNAQLQISLQRLPTLLLSAAFSSIWYFFSQGVCLTFFLFDFLFAVVIA